MPIAPPPSTNPRVRVKPLSPDELTHEERDALTELGSFYGLSWREVFDGMAADVEIRFDDPQWRCGCYMVSDADIF